MKPDKRNNNDSGNNKRNALGLVSIILWALFLTLLFRSCWSSYENAGMVEVPYTTFKEWLEADKIQQANVESGQITFTLREGVEVELPQQEETGGAGGLMNALLPEPPQDETAVTEYVTVRLSGVSDAELMKQLEEHLPDGAYTEPVDNSAYLLNLFLAYILPILVMVGLFLFMFRGVGGKGGIGGMGNLGKSNAKVYVEKKTGVTFRDVAGQDEAKESLQEIIDILHNPQKYTEIGAKLPKGALLVGPPGTGKTLLAKAVAGEANVPFFSISGSDFVEMFVGMGAARVRDLFRQAAQKAPWPTKVKVTLGIMFGVLVACLVVRLAVPSLQENQILNSATTLLLGLSCGALYLIRKDYPAPKPSKLDGVVNAVLIVFALVYGLLGVWGLLQLLA